MQEAKHTPGPWKCGIWDGEPNTVEIYAVQKTDVGADSIHVAYINKGNTASLDDMDIGNARLIAAAPNLLAALEAILDAGKIAGVFGPYEEAGKIPAAVYREGRAAIAKATASEGAA